MTRPLPFNRRRWRTAMAALSFTVLGLSANAFAGTTILGIDGARFTLNGKPTFLLGCSYYGALSASQDFIRLDLDEMQRLGFNWIRVWANWRAFATDAAAVDAEGQPIPAGLENLRWLVNECDRRGLIVDVTFSRGNGVFPQRRRAGQTRRKAAAFI